MPVDSALFGIDFVAQGFDFGRLKFEFADTAASKALAGHRPHFAVGHVQPTAILGCMRYVQPPDILKRLVCRKGFVERAVRVCVEIVVHQFDGLAIGVPSLRQVSHFNRQVHAFFEVGQWPVGMRQVVRQTWKCWQFRFARILQLDTFLQNVMEEGKETVLWDVTSLILVIAKLLEPWRGLYISEQWYPKTSLAYLLGASEGHVDDNRLYRCLDKLVPHKKALEVHLTNRMGELFDLE